MADTVPTQSLSMPQKVTSNYCVHRQFVTRELVGPSKRFNRTRFNTVKGKHFSKG